MTDVTRGASAPTPTRRPRARRQHRSRRHARPAPHRRGRPVRDPPRHRRPGRDARAAARRAARRRPRPPRGRPRPRQDADRSAPSPTRSTRTFERIQFTPDLLPGRPHRHRGSTSPRPGDVRHRKGPIFATSSSPTRSTARRPRSRRRCSRRCRSARSRSASRPPRSRSRSSCWPPRTPSSHEGTYPLPEAQVDRFMMKVVRRLPDRRPRRRRSWSARSARPPRSAPVLAAERPRPAARPRRPSIYVDPAIVEYAVAIVTATREPGRVRPGRARRRYIGFGASPRGSIDLIHAARAPRADPRPPLRHPGGRAEPRPRRAPPPDRAVVHGAGRGGQRRDAARPDHPGRPGPAPGDRGADRRDRDRRASRPRPRVARTPAGRARAHAGGAAARPRRDHRAPDPRASSRASSGPTTWAAAPSSPRSGRTSRATTSAGSTGTSRPGCTCPTSGSTSRSARSRPGSSSTRRRR